MKPIRIEKTTRSDHFVEMYPAVYDSAKPSRSPPAIAPGIEPMPPITAAVKPFSPETKPIETVAVRGARTSRRRAGERGTEDEREHDHPSMSIPIIAAASRSNDVARIALPVRVRLTRNHSTIISTNAETIVMMRSNGTRTLPMSTPFR